MAKMIHRNIQFIDNTMVIYCNIKAAKVNNHNHLRMLTAAATSRTTAAARPAGRGSIALSSATIPARTVYQEMSLVRKR